MNAYGTFAESMEFDGEVFAADVIEEAYAKRAGVDKIFAVNGLPKHFENELISSSQVSDVPHTWRVQECATADEVTPEILARGKIALDRDRAELNSYIITYVAGSNGTNFEFLAAGAVRNKLTRDFYDPLFPVVSRAIVAPRHRGKGLGSLIVEHRMKAVLNGFFGVKPKAIHFGTESKKILTSVKKVEADEGLKFVYIGDESYASADGTHTVHDFLSFLPWYQKQLLEACDALGSSAGAFKDYLGRFMHGGVEMVSGSALESAFNELSRQVSLQAHSVPSATEALKTLAQVFQVKEKIGAKDPM